MTTEEGEDLTVSLASDVAGGAGCGGGVGSSNTEHTEREATP